MYGGEPRREDHFFERTLLLWVHSDLKDSRKTEDSYMEVLGKQARRSESAAMLDEKGYGGAPARQASFHNYSHVVINSQY